MRIVALDPGDVRIAVSYAPLCRSGGRRELISNAGVRAGGGIPPIARAVLRLVLLTGTAAGAWLVLSQADAQAAHADAGTTAEQTASGSAPSVSVSLVGGLLTSTGQTVDALLDHFPQPVVPHAAAAASTQPAAAGARPVAAAASPQINEATRAAPALGPIAGILTPTASGLAPVTTALAPLTTALAPVLAPLTGVTTALAPVFAPLTGVTTALAPLTTALAPVTTALAPLTTALAPVTTALAPLTTALAPLTTALAPVLAPLAPVTAALAPVLAPLTGPLEPVTGLLPGAQSATGRFGSTLALSIAAPAASGHPAALGWTGIPAGAWTSAASPPSPRGGSDAVVPAGPLPLAPTSPAQPPCPVTPAGAATAGSANGSGHSTKAMAFLTGTWHPELSSGRVVPARLMAFSGRSVRPDQRGG